MKFFVVVFCLTLAVANGQRGFMSSLSNLIGANKEFVSAATNTAAGAVQGVADMKASATNMVTGAVNKGIKNTVGAVSTMADFNMQGAQKVSENILPSGVGSLVSGAIGMGNKMQQSSANIMSAALQTPMSMIAKGMGLEVAAFNSAVGAGARMVNAVVGGAHDMAQTAVNLVGGVSSVSGQMGKVLPQLMHNMPIKVLNLAMAIRKGDFVEKIKHAVTQVKEAIEKHIKELNEDLKNVINKLTSEENKARLVQLKNGMHDLFTGVEGAVDEIVSVAKEMGLSENLEANLRTVLGGIETAVKKAQEMQTAISGGLDHLKEEMQKINETLNSQEMAQLRSELDAFVPQLMKGEADVGAFVDKVVSTIPSLEAQKDNLKAALQKVEDIVNEVGPKMKKMQEEIEGLMKNLPFGDVLGQLHTNVMNVISSMGGMNALMSQAGVMGSAANLIAGAGNMAGGLGASAGVGVGGGRIGVSGSIGW